MAKLTILGIENYEKANERSLFSSLVFPEGINKDDATNTILMRCGEFETLYTEPSFLRDAIGLWGRKWYNTFDRWNKALSIEYNPLENYDRNEHWTDAHTGTDTTDLDIVKTTDEHGKQVNTNVTGEQSFDSTLGQMTITDTMAQQHTINETKVAAYDSDSYSNSDKVEGTIDPHTDTHTTSEHTNNNVQGERTDTLTSDKYTDTQTVDARTDVLTHDTVVEHNARIHGNVGVTTSQQMLESELNIARWNLLHHIADLFADEFTLMVY